MLTTLLAKNPSLNKTGKSLKQVLTLGQQETSKEHVQQEDEPGKSVGHDDGPGQSCNEAEEGQRVLVRQHEEEHKAEKPAVASDISPMGCMG